MNNNLIIFIIVVVLIALGIWIWNPSSDQSSTIASPTTEDTTTAITDDLSGIQVETSDADLDALDTDLQNL